MADRDLSSGVPVTEFTAQEMIAGRLGDEQILLVRDGGDIRAIGAHCSHYHAPLVDGAVIDGTLRCPWHHACFDLKSGAVLRAPALHGLPVWNVERRDDRFFVTDRIEESVVDHPPSGPQNVVIIGAGTAGVNAAVTLRKEGYRGTILMISGEPDLPYDKPNLSKDYLAGTAPADWLPLYPREYYEDQRIDLLLGVTVTSLDTTAKRITTSAGQVLSYGALVLATGSVLRTLPIGGEHIHYIRTRRDAETLAEKIPSARRAVVIGSSFIGLEVAASLRQRGLEVTVTSPERVPLERVLGEALGTRIQAIHQDRGVTFRLGRTLLGVERNTVLLDDGSRIEGDLIVAGIGVTPAVDLAREAGLAVGEGVVVDEYLETSSPGVYACGDIASLPGSRGERLRVEHWVVAGRQGQAVARNILGERRKFDAVPFFWSSHYDVTISYVGHAKRWDAVEVRGSLEENDAAIVYRTEGRIQAVATIARDRLSLAAEEALERGDLERVNELLSARRQ